MDTKRILSTVSKAALGIGFFAGAIEMFMDAREPKSVGRLGSANLGKQRENVRRVTTAPSQTLGKPKMQKHDVWSIDARVKLIRKLIVAGHLNPTLHERTVEILSQKCGGNWCVAEKDCKGEVEWLFNAIRNPRSKYAVRYTRDMLLADTFSAAERTLLKKHGGDCFVKGTKVLKRGHKLVPIEALEVGDEVWGYGRWSRVVNTWDKGILPTWLIRLNNGSTMRLTPDHKVWIGDEVKRREATQPIKNSERVANLRRVYVRDLQPGDVVIQPDAVPFGETAMDPRRAYVEGLFVSDGFKSHEHDFAISGKDGHPKEAQKREVEAICAALGVATNWHERYITVKDAEWAARLGQLGGHAPEKHVATLDLDAAAATELLRGVMADSGANSMAGRTFTTTSRELFLQTRVLLKMRGISCGARYIEDHGGLGQNPIYRLQTREPRSDGKSNKLLRVKEVIADELALPCFDIATDDHMVWLPEADWTTSQCDDYTVLLGAMLMTVGHPVKVRVVAANNPEAGNPWSHVYLITPTKFDDPSAPWMAVDCSVTGKKAGWEAPGAAESAALGKPAGMIHRVRDFPVP